MVTRYFEPVTSESSRSSSCEKSVLIFNKAQKINRVVDERIDEDKKFFNINKKLTYPILKVNKYNANKAILK